MVRPCIRPALLLGLLALGLLAALARAPELAGQDSAGTGDTVRLSTPVPGPYGRDTANRVVTGRPDSAGPGAASDSIRTDTTVPRPVSDSTTASDSTRRDSSVRDTAQPDTAQPDTARPDTARPDTARPDTARPDSVRADSAGARRLRSDSGSVQRRGPPDTSLTARMDARRGGGLKRSDFPDLLASARMIGSYRVFLGLVDAAGWTPRLGGSGNYTLLAPTDSAFGGISPDQLDAMRADSAGLVALIRAHTLEGSHSAADLARQGSVRTLDGETRSVTRGPGGTYRVGAARLTRPDLVARNGVLHGIDRLLTVIPPRR